MPARSYPASEAPYSYDMADTDIAALSDLLEASAPGVKVRGISVSVAAYERRLNAERAGDVTVAFTLEGSAAALVATGLISNSEVESVGKSAVKQLGNRTLKRLKGKYRLAVHDVAASHGYSEAISNMATDFLVTRTFATIWSRIKRSGA